MDNFTVLAEVGTEFEFGGRTFRLDYLTCDGECKLLDLLEPLLREAIARENATNRTVMSVIRSVAMDALSVILIDLDGSVSADWVKSIREPGTAAKAFAIVGAVFELQGLGKSLNQQIMAGVYIDAQAMPLAAKVLEMTEAAAT